MDTDQPTGQEEVNQQDTTPSQPTQTGAGRPRHTLRASANVGVIVLLMLCALTIIFFFLGLGFQPAASEPAPIPNTPIFNILFPARSHPPTNLSIYSFLAPTSAVQSRLAIEMTGLFMPGQQSISWTLGVQGFSGQLCPGSSQQAKLTSLGARNDYEVNGSSPIPRIAGEPFLEISLCWNNNPPLITQGSYLSAALPPILAPPGQVGTVTRSLELGGTALSSYSLAGGLAPTETTGRSWVWTSALSGDFSSQARAEIPIIAASLPGLQRDNHGIFYSGIFFGIAGGAAVSVVPALLDAVDRTKTRYRRTSPTEPAQASPNDPPHGATKN